MDFRIVRAVDSPEQESIFSFYIFPYIVVRKKTLMKLVEIAVSSSVSLQECDSLLEQ